MNAADVATRVKERFGLDSPAEGALVAREKVVELSRMLKDECGFHFLVYVTGAHFLAVAEKKKGETVEPAVPEHYIAAYRVRNLHDNLEYTFRCRVDVGTPIATVYPVWAGADWQERECFDLVGIVFEGHPDLRRIMLPEDWEGHPLHRDYPIETPHTPWR